MAYEYMPPDVIAGFDNYKYSSVDTSPISNYIVHPFWNRAVKVFPKWLAPNLMTLVGFLCLVFQLSILTYYDPAFYAASRSHTEHPPIPNWVWLMCAILTFAAHTLDGCDGKQARRTNSSSPLGELFDHGLDSWASLIIPVSVYSVFGRGESGVNVFRVYLVLIGIMVCFIISHWEKYNTGVLFLPWGYDISQISLTVVYIITYVCGYEWWKFSVTIPYIDVAFTTAEGFELIMHVTSYGMSFSMSLWNVVRSYKDKSGNNLSMYECMLPLFSTVVTFGVFLVWAVGSKCDIVEQQPRLFYWASGTVFSNITCRLIVRQMSQTRADPFNWLLLGPLMCLVCSVIVCDLSGHEVQLLWAYSVFVTLCHLHFGCFVVKQMAEHFKIRPFSIKSKDE